MDSGLNTFLYLSLCSECDIWMQGKKNTLSLGHCYPFFKFEKKEEEEKKIDHFE